MTRNLRAPRGARSRSDGCDMCVTVPGLPGCAFDSPLSAFRSSRRTIELIEQMYDFSGDAAFQLVIDRAGIAPGLHQVITPQPSKMLGEMGLPHPEQFLQFTNGFFASGDMTQNDEAVLVRQRFE